MTPTNFRALLVARYGQRSMRELTRLAAADLGMSVAQVRRYWYGASPIDQRTEMALRSLPELTVPQSP